METKTLTFSNNIWRITKVRITNIDFNNTIANCVCDTIVEKRFIRLMFYLYNYILKHQVILK